MDTLTTPTTRSEHEKVFAAISVNRNVDCDTWLAYADRLLAVRDRLTAENYTQDVWGEVLAEADPEAAACGMAACIGGHLIGADPTLRPLLVGPFGLGSVDYGDYIYAITPGENIWLYTGSPHSDWPAPYSHAWRLAGKVPEARVNIAYELLSAVFSGIQDHFTYEDEDATLSWNELFDLIEAAW
jgi:hypothetical protein